MAASAALFAGCSSNNQPAENAELAALRASVEEARAAAIQANQTSQQALALAQQNAAKIDRAFVGKQRK
ncbi:MAG: hypothetical protein J6M05_02020 [Cardiobacteriaceae bacterium]|nr:hypothetical protein [Cardiobacteriaceae bacterium]